MIPSKTWFPSSLAERAAWMQNFTTQFAVYAVIPLGFIAADVTAQEKDNEDFQSIAATTVAVEAFRSAIIEYRLSLTEGDIGDADPMFPPSTFTGPPNDRPAGMFERLNDLRERILAAPAYTDEIGAALGIIGEGGTVIAEGDVQPEIEVFAAATGYVFSIVVSKRYDADQWQVWVTPAGMSNWQILATATGKSTDVTYQPGGEVPAPVQLQVRVQLRRSNENYGDPSMIGQVTVNP